MDTGSTNNQAVLASLRRVLRRMLYPVSGMLLRHGLSHRELVDACKEAYVKAAADEDLKRGKAINISRVALVTGMARRDVRQVVNQPPEGERTGDVRQNNATRVLSGWFQDPEFCDPKGEPRTLPAEGKTGSFEALVRRYASDIPAGTIAKDLIRVNSVARAENNSYAAISRSYRPAQEYPLTPQAIDRVGSVFEDLGRTVDHNLHRRTEEPGRFERRATNVNVSVEDIPEFRQFVEVEAQRFLEKIDAWLTEHEHTDDAEGRKERCRLGMGTYWIEQDAAGES